MQYAIFMWMPDKHMWIFYGIRNNQHRALTEIKRAGFIFHIYELPLQPAKDNNAAN